MSKPVVIVVPGIMGSSLEGKRWGLIWQDIWLSVATLAGDLRVLSLGSDGLTPRSDAGVTDVRATSPVEAYYGILTGFLKLCGFDVDGYGYDWRKSILNTGERLANRIQRLYPGRDVVFVAHSMGGLVARVAWKFLQQRGQDHIQRLITLGTPHRGAVSILALFGHLDPTWDLLVTAQGGPFVSREKAGRLVDDVVSTMPSVYEMLPVRGWNIMQDDAAIRNAMTYAAFNTFVSQAWLDAADTTQTFLRDAGDPSRTLCLVGTGIDTFIKVADASKLNGREGYLSSDEGDGRVPADSAAWPNASALALEGVAHHTMPYSPSVLKQLPTIIGNPSFLARA